MNNHIKGPVAWALNLTAYIHVVRSWCVDSNNVTSTLFPSVKNWLSF